MSLCGLKNVELHSDIEYYNVTYKISKNELENRAILFIFSKTQKSSSEEELLYFFIFHFLSWQHH